MEQKGKNNKERILENKKYCIKKDYYPQETAKPNEYWEKEREIRCAPYYQYHVYDYAQEVIEQSSGLCSVLDIGCGVAIKLDKLIKPFVSETVGIDVKKIVGFNKEKFPEIKFYCDDIENPEIELDKKFDLIISCEVIEHLQNPDKLVQYIKKFTHPQSRIIVSTPAREKLKGEGSKFPYWPSHVREWAKEEFQTYLEDRGFQILDQKIIPFMKLGINWCTLYNLKRLLLDQINPTHTQVYLLALKR